MLEESINIGRANLNVARSADSGPPLLPLLMWHGLVRSWRDFSTLLPALTPRYAVAAVDHRGHGKSARAPGEYRVTDYVADGIAIVRSGVRGPAILYGHSLGALAALGAAAECPESVRAVILEDPPSASMMANIGETNYGITWRAMRGLAGNTDVAATSRTLSSIRLIDGRLLGAVRDAAAIRFLASCLVDLDPGVLAPPLDGTWFDGFDLRETATRVRCPVLLLASDPALGGMLRARDADALAEALPDCYRVDFPGRGHLLHGEHPEAVLKVLLPFLESLR